MMMSSTTRFLMSSKSHVYWRTASAVPWNHSLSVGVCVAASTWARKVRAQLTAQSSVAVDANKTSQEAGTSRGQCNRGQELRNTCMQTVEGAQKGTSTKPSPPKRTPEPMLYVRARWRLSEVELNCVRM